jgi:hypothetical protein
LVLHLRNVISFFFRKACDRKLHVLKLVKPYVHKVERAGFGCGVEVDDDDEDGEDDSDDASDLDVTVGGDENVRSDGK